MTLLQITYQAKCEDCEFCEMYYKGEKKLQKRHRCTNPKTLSTNIALKDEACDQLKLKES